MHQGSSGVCGKTYCKALPLFRLVAVLWWVMGKEMVIGQVVARENNILSFLSPGLYRSSQYHKLPISKSCINFSLPPVSWDFQFLRI